MSEKRFLTQAQAAGLKKAAIRAYESFAAKGSYDWVRAYHQAIAEATVRPGDAALCALCEHCGYDQQCGHADYRESHCPKEAK